MVCVYCGGETKVANSRPLKRNNQVWRRRKCLVCKAVFTTREAVELETALVVVKNGQNRPFLAGLLRKELMDALKHREDVYTASEELLGAIVRQLLALPGRPVFQADDIARVTSEVLKRFDKRAHLRYIADHPS